MPIRQRITPALPILIFLFAYFFTTVLGNILYTLPLGRKFPTRSMPEFTWEQFHQPLDARFWLLVLCPLLVTPVGAYLVARFSKPAITGMSAVVPEFSRQFFVAVNAACLLFVGFHLYDANALGKLLAGKDALDAVRYRFDLLGEIGRAPRFVLMSILQFLSCYAMVKAIRSRKAFWVASAIINIVFVSAFFILLNMKWPIVLFQITLASVAFICVPRRYIVVSSLIFAGSILTYFTVSVALLRIPLDISAVPPPSIEKYEPGPRKVPPPAHATDQVVNDLVIVAINRMAMAVPFYYDTFTSDGPVCGSFLDKVVLRKPEACHPSIYIYSKMFPDDRINGRGTAPAAHQIYEIRRAAVGQEQPLLSSSGPSLSGCIPPAFLHEIPHLRNGFCDGDSRFLPAVPVTSRSDDHFGAWRCLVDFADSRLFHLEARLSLQPKTRRSHRS